MSHSNIDSRAQPAVLSIMHTPTKHGLMIEAYRASYGETLEKLQLTCRFIEAIHLMV
uniref:Uncharacterized protein n=1 Tax=Arion vulgaris TaxID=1028688 RepID=A0A0B7BMC0_9EUPU